MYTLFLVGSFIFVLAILFIITSAFLGFLITRVPFVRTSAEDIKFIIAKLGITDRDVFYDLGSGDGKVCFLVNELTGAKCVGFELTWWTHVWAKLKGKIQNSKVQFRNQNFFKHSWQEANYIYAYLYPPLMGRVKEKFLAECKSGSLAIVRDFPFPNMPYKEKHCLLKKHEIYVYRL